jgi:putative two-component system response regulator
MTISDKRPVYREAMTHEEARAYIVGQSGRHFDPAVVEAFVERKMRFAAIAKKFLA